jgi:hypothetical protein
MYIPESSSLFTISCVRRSLVSRSRYTGLLSQFRPGLSGDDQALAARTTARGDLVWRRLTFVGEFQDARAYLTDAQSNVTTTLVNVAVEDDAEGDAHDHAVARPGACRVLRMFLLGHRSGETGPDCRRPHNPDAFFREPPARDVRF